MRKNSKWLICGLLFLATLVNYLDRQTISVSASRIADEMRLNDGDLGKLFSGFLFAYAFAQLFIGPVLDRFGTIPAFAVAVAAWSLAGASSALAPAFGFLLVTRVLLGVCESPNWPLALRIVTRLFPPSERAFANGIFQSGTSLGALIAPPIIIYLTVTYNWRLSFVAVGAVGLIWAILWRSWFFFFPEPLLDKQNEVAKAEPSGAESGAGAPASVGAMLRSPAFWGLVVATSFLNPLQYFYTTWIPRYFDKYAHVGFGRELAKRLVIVYLALDVGLWTGGALVAWLARRMDTARARVIVTAVGALCMAMIPAVALVQDLNSITAIICLATFGLGWFMVNYLAFTAEVSKTRVSTAAGLLGGTGSLAGAGFMLLVGGTVEHSHSFTTAFIMAGIMPLIALSGIVLSVRAARASQAQAAPI